jgi:hypothetical protein
MDHKLVLRPTGKMKRKGEVYEVLLGDEIIASGTSPECAACRVLKSRGHSGKAAFWREGKHTWDIRMDIEWAAGRYVAEEAKQGIRFAKWEPHPMARKPDDEDMDEAA